MLAPDELHKSRRNEMVAEIEALADKLEPKIARAVHGALQEQRALADLEAMAEILRSGNVERIFALLNLESMTAALTPIKVSVTTTAAAAGALAAKMPALREAGFVFDAINPTLVAWVQRYSFDLIRQISTASQAGIREAMIQGMTAGQGPRDTAVRIKNVVGLTESQARAVLRYRRELETFHTRRTGGGYRLGGKIDRVNGEQVFRPDADGDPKDGITERRLRDFRYDRTLQSAIRNRKPIDPKMIDKMVDAYQRKYIRHRAQTIARTESMRATQFGIMDAWRQAIASGKVPEEAVRKQWIVSRDERTCPTCSPIPGLNPPQGQRFAMPFATPIGPVSAPPIHPQCFPGGTQITSAGRINGATKRWYTGELAVILTSGGKQVSATVNHPVLTNHGWVPIGELNEGSYVITRADGKSSQFHNDNDHVPSSIEKIAGAFMESGGVSPIEVPMSAKDFHGDGVPGEIAVVAANGYLRSHLDAYAAQGFLQPTLMTALQSLRHLLSGSGDLFSMLISVLGPSYRCVCSNNLSAPRFGGHNAPFQTLGLTSIPQGHTTTYQEPVNRRSADAALAAQLLRGDSGKVSPDKVVAVRRIPFSGHVYNLETIDGHYTANGIISHNCRCSLFIRTYETWELA